MTIDTSKYYMKVRYKRGHWIVSRIAIILNVIGIISGDRASDWITWRLEITGPFMKPEGDSYDRP